MSPNTYTQAMKEIVKDYPDLLDRVEKITYNEVPQMIEAYNRLE